jgi:3-hydroxyisobutyrate dehydrogenase-like beta-hydroxyacid dehydrogenase
MKVAFIGLGVMGFPMAGHLQQSGLELTVFNRTAKRAQQWVNEYGGACADSPADASRAADIVFCCVGNDDDVRAVVTGADGVLGELKSGAILVDHTTASAELARELEDAAKAAGAGFLDAPVSGGQAGAENGVLTIMVGGEEATFARAEPVMEHYARCTRLLGPAGSGQLAKMVNQVCIAGVVQGLAEGLNFARAAGLDPAAVVEVISRGAAQSWQMENRYQTMLAGHYEHGFAVDWMRKDLAIVLEQAEKLGLDMSLTRQVDAFYEEVQDMGGGRWDTSSLLARLER